MNNNTENHAERQAEAQVNSIRAMVAALLCDYDELERLRDAQASGEAMDENDIAELDRLEREAGDCKDNEDARQTILDDALEVSVRSGWQTPYETLEPDEFRILLCTGGPAVQIVGDLDQHMQPVSCRVEYQDWGTPWTDYPLDSITEEVVLTYCQQFLGD